MSGVGGSRGVKVGVGVHCFAKKKEEERRRKKKEEERRRKERGKEKKKNKLEGTVWRFLDLIYLQIRKDNPV